MNTPSNTTDKESVLVAVSLGSNLSHQDRRPQELVLSAMQSVSQIGSEPRLSSLYRSEPVDCPPGSGEFINAGMLLHISADVSAAALLGLLQGIEADFGRQRSAQQNQSRTLDLDIISYGNQELESEDLILPHPRALSRRFVLMPLAEIDAEFVLPGQGASVAQLLASLPAGESVERLDDLG
ncbi:MAG: 2-amino-4-hydroxy-6-hydroxymethyldihydropteridine diphosphokinase [Pseudohongiella sp.]|nr:MAG: 2-amino-4-hydroxy-6-hydroxymethyldihydropteridine diphosphokinase [Pseudohongiella sp.]